MELINNKIGKCFFTIGDFEVGCYQNLHLKDSKYLGRFKTKDKYLCLLKIISKNLVKKETMKHEEEQIFFEECSDYIIGDVFFIDDINIENNLDNLKCINDFISTKENIIVINLETNKELECFTYFSNIGYLGEELKSIIGIINEYKEEQKLETKKKLIELDMILNGKNVHEFINELKDLKDKKDSHKK